LTVSQALLLATRRLSKAGVEYPDLDAELLLRHVLDWDRARVVAEGTSDLPPGTEARFLSLVEGRARRRPLQHLTGTQHFWRHEFVVSPDVLIPRPETEVLVETSLELLRDVGGPLVVDVGTGSGCIALSLAAERPDARVHAVDVSPGALAVARENAQRLGLGRVRFHEGDLLEPVASFSGRIALVASNPPYVSCAELPELMPEVRDHEPPIALVPPSEPYSVYRRLATQASATLAPGGWLVAEIGLDMDREVTRICEAAGLAVQRVVPDLRSIPRTVVARKPQ
jgi:release factor glutamine methyltransferase